MFREYISNNGKARNLLDRWISLGHNLYQVPPVVKSQLVYMLSVDFVCFKSDVTHYGYNAAFINFIKKLLKEYEDEENSKNKTKYELFYSRLNTLDGRWDIEPSHFNIACDTAHKHRVNTSDQDLNVDTLVSINSMLPC